MSQNISRKVPSKDLKTFAKVDLVEKIETSLGIEKRQALSLSEAILTVITNALLDKFEVRLARIGTLSVSHKKERPGRNPKTLEDSVISSRYTVSLRNGKRGDSERLNQPEIIVLIAKELPNVNRDYIKSAFYQFLRLIQQVEDGKSRVEIRGFGVFYPSFYPAGRKVRNPRTGDVMESKEKTSIRFKLSKLIRVRLNS